MMSRLVAALGITVALVFFCATSARAADDRLCPIAFAGSPGEVWSSVSWRPGEFWYRLASGPSERSPRSARVVVATKENIYHFDVAEVALAPDPTLTDAKALISSPALFAVPAGETVELTWIDAYDGSPCVPAPRVASTDFGKPAMRAYADALALLPAPNQRGIQTPEWVSSVRDAAPCGKVWMPARTIVPVTPKTPEMARQRGDTGVAFVRVTLDAAGTTRRVRIQRSSGIPLLDEAALDAARKATFASGMLLCRPIGGDYIYVVEFQ